jgi:hypothetical protein
MSNLYLLINGEGVPPEYLVALMKAVHKYGGCGSLDLEAWIWRLDCVWRTWLEARR